MINFLILSALAILAQAGVAQTIGWWVILAIAVAGIIGLLYLGVRAAGLTIPPWFIQAFWIVLAVFVLIGAVKLILMML